MKRRAFTRGLALLTSSAGGLFLPGCAPTRRLYHWSGIAFGTKATLVFNPPSGTDPMDLAERCSAEIRRLESVFTLSEAASPVRRLNAAGVLTEPPPELVDALQLCAEVHALTEGAFDVTVQPLWELYEDHFRRHPEGGTGPPPDEVAAAREQVGFEHVTFGPDGVRFGKPGMALTLNGMAQGFVTERVAAWLVAEGVEQALVNVGEYRAIGTHPDGAPWEVGVTDWSSGEILETVELVDRALATSSGSGFLFDAGGRFHHLIHPSSGAFSQAGRVIRMVGTDTGWVDALATAAGVMEPGAFAAVLASEPARIREVEARFFPA